MHRSGRTYLLQLILLLNCRTTRFIPSLLLRRLTPTSSSLSLASFFRLQFGLFSFPSVLLSFIPYFLFSFSHSLITAFTFSLNIFFPSFFLPFHLSDDSLSIPTPLFLPVFLLLLFILFTSFCFYFYLSSLILIFHSLIMFSLYLPS